MTVTFKPKGSWEKKLKTTIELPEYVHSFLRLKSVVSDKYIHEIILEALIHYYEIQPPPDYKNKNT